LHKMRHTKDDAHHDEEAVRSDSQEVDEKLPKSVSPPEDEADDGWASEGSGSGTSARGSRTRSRSSKQKILGKSHVGQGSRRRNSFRSKRIGGPAARAPVEEEAPASRGSMTPVRRGPAFLDNDSRAGSLRNIRLENLRQIGTQSPREHSPARSVRFVDNERVNANAPRTFTSSSIKGPSSSQRNSLSDDEDEAKTKVAYEAAYEPKT